MATAPEAPEKMTLDRSDGSATIVLYRAALGPLRADYYIKAFTRFDAAGKTGPSWNWTAALLSLNWMVFRQLWAAALAYAGSVAACTLLLFGIGRLVFQLSAETQWALLGLAVLLAVAVPGALGNGWLYASINKRMERALIASSTLEEACNRLARSADGSRRLGGLAGLNLALCAAVAAAVVSWPDSGALPLNTSNMVQARVNGLVQSGLALQPSGPASTPQASAPAPIPALGAMPLALASTLPASAAASAPTAAAPPDGQGAAARSSQGMVQAGAIAAAALARPSPVAATVSPPEHVAALSSVPASVSAPPTKKSAAQKKATAARAAKAEKAAQTAKTSKASKAEKLAKAKERGKASASATTKANAADPSVTKNTAPLPGAAVTEKYLINVGLFADTNNARNALAKLQDAGLPAQSQAIKSARGQRTRVRVGPFETLAEADRVAEKIRGLQLDAAVFKP